VFSAVVGVGMLLLGAFGAVRGMPWALSFLLAALGAAMLIGLGRPLYRTAVYRASTQEILCRFVPWYQSTHLVASAMFPLIGIAAIAPGGKPDLPSWVRYTGGVALIMGIVLALSALLAWQANRLVITPSTLSIRIVFRAEQCISREQVRAITPRLGTNATTGAPRVHVDVTYTPADPSSRSTVTIGRLEGQFTVDPANLAAGLQAWKDGDPGDPELLDRIEAILRGHPHHDQRT
jgi:hypothetical protein